MKFTYQQPHKVLNLGLPLFWSHFTDSLNPSTIGLVDRHRILRVKSFVVKQLYPFLLPINLFFLNCQVARKGQALEIPGREYQMIRLLLALEVIGLVPILFAAPAMARAIWMFQ